VRTYFSGTTIAPIEKAEAGENGIEV